MADKAENLKARLQDRKYRVAYAESLLDDAIALQIRKLREDRGLSQAELGRRAGMKQGAISRIESSDYGAWSVSTLKRIAAALDLPLSIRFESWGHLVEAATHLTLEHLAVPSFERDPKIRASVRHPYVTSINSAGWWDAMIQDPMTGALTVFEFKAIRQPGNETVKGPIDMTTSTVALSHYTNAAATTEAGAPQNRRVA